MAGENDPSLLVCFSLSSIENLIDQMYSVSEDFFSRMLDYELSIKLMAFFVLELEFIWLWLGLNLSVAIIRVWMLNSMI